ncbi:hypothetical protein HanLR1_Chr05g0184971 [Helianthus annuus]|nr:hypothetical protein HanLR1_Chr05g0184971 [Helianthus annuus]
MEETRLCSWTVFRSVFAIFQWWSFNVAVIIMNKWIFQVLFQFDSLVESVLFVDSLITVIG